MELVKVRITRTVITARYGALSPGDILSTDLMFARHLVDDCSAAKFLETKSDTEDKKLLIKKRRK